MTIPNMIIFWQNSLEIIKKLKKLKYDYLQYNYFFRNGKIWLFAIWVFFQKKSHISLKNIKKKTYAPASSSLLNIKNLQGMRVGFN